MAANLVFLSKILPQIHEVFMATGCCYQGTPYSHRQRHQRCRCICKRGGAVVFNLTKQFPSAIEFLDLGGGFKVSYKHGDQETDIDCAGFQAWMNRYLFENIGVEDEFMVRTGKIPGE